MREEEMNCKEICELLIAYLDGEVTPEEKASIEAHLPGCPECRAELKALLATQVSLRGALKSMAEEVSPSPQAWEKVRARLDTRGGWLDGLHRLLTSKTWQVATVTAAVVVIAVVAAIWQFGGVGQAPPIPAPAPAPAPAPVPPRPPGSPPGPMTPPEAGYSVQTDYIPSQTIYMPGEQIEIEVRLTNQSTAPVIIEQFPPKVSITRPDTINVEEFGPGEILGTAIHTFPAGTEERELGVDETISFKLTWDQKDENGNQVPPGWYHRQSELHLRTVTEPVNRWKTGGGERIFLIQYPQGAMEKTIDLNLSQTASGLPLEVDNEIIPVDVVLTLKRVELTQEGVSFFVLLTSPDYPLPGDEDVWWRRALDEHAEYMFNGTVKDARGANTKYTDEGIELRWGREGSYRDPIPSDTKELTFTITKLGDDWEGPWEFKVPLE